MRQFGLIGYPLGHSFSKGYFTLKFQKEGIIDAVYGNYELESIRDYPSLIASLPGLVGLNVTIPYKEAVIPYLDGLSEAAMAIGAVNTIHFIEGKGIGYNTDYIGFRESVQPMLSPLHRRALILGTGGSSKAVAYALKGMGLVCSYVSREPQNNKLGYQDLTPQIFKEHLLIVNTTPLGMYPNTESAPNIPYHYLTEDHILYDLVYNPLETAFLKKGKMHGCKVQNGLPMLQLQAEAAWKIWNN